MTTLAAPARPVSYLLGMGGLGDSIYQRPFVKAEAARAETYLSTPWPELYSDVPDLGFVCPWNMALRTQQKNIQRQPPGTWTMIPTRQHTCRTFWYGLAPGRAHTPTGGGVMAEMEARTGIPLGERFDFDLPDFGYSPVRVRRPVAVLRPVTTRKEWNANARAPLPGYVAAAAHLLRRAGYYVVAVADIEEPHEWLEGEMPARDRYFVRGELTTPRLMALMQNADIVVGGVGWIVPAGLAFRVPTVIIAGGLGAFNAPELLVDPRMDASRMRWLLPEKYCRCRDRAHQCAKEIADFPDRFWTAVAEVAA